MRRIEENALFKVLKAAKQYVAVRMDPPIYVANSTNPRFASDTMAWHRMEQLLAEDLADAVTDWENVSK